MNKLATITITMGRHSAMNKVVMNAQLMCTPLHAELFGSGHEL